VAAVRESEARLYEWRKALRTGSRELIARRAELSEARQSLLAPASPLAKPAMTSDVGSQRAQRAPASRLLPNVSEQRQLIQLRRAAMLMQLFQIFAIRVSSDGRSERALYTINNLRPTPLVESAGSDDEENAAALGLVARLVQSAAHILLVPLRHPLDVRASRSHVVDASVAAPARLPLYARGSDPAAYRRAQQLLARNVEQLLDAVGVSHAAGGELLPSLEVLMSRVRKSPLSIRPW